jgi:hypothetical protein
VVIHTLFFPIKFTTDATSTELRNTIYANLIIPTSSHACPTTTSNWNLFQRHTLGLTQACRQLRLEFLPLYNANTRIEIALCEMNEYLASCISPHILLNPSYISVIRGEMPSIRPYSIDDVRAVILAPNVDLQLNLSSTHDTMLEPAISSPWYAYLERAVAKLEVNTCREWWRRDEDEVVVWVKEECKEIWMIGAKEDGNLPQRAGKSKWARQLGVGNGKAYTVRVHKV